LDEAFLFLHSSTSWFINDATDHFLLGIDKKEVTGGKCSSGARSGGGYASTRAIAACPWISAFSGDFPGGSRSPCGKPDREVESG
jgi:hypothetical protein